MVQTSNQLIHQLLDSADSNDKETFAKTFTPSIQKREDFNAVIDNFLKSYPKGLSKCEVVDVLVPISGSYEQEKNIVTGLSYYTCTLNKEKYNIFMQLCYENVKFPDDVGVMLFKIQNLDGQALDIEYKDGDYLICATGSHDDITVRLINGCGVKYKPVSERKLTVNNMEKLISKYDNIHDIIAEIGEPDGIKNYTNSNVSDFYYELPYKNNEPRYAEIDADKFSGKIYSAGTCSDKYIIDNEDNFKLKGK